MEYYFSKTLKDISIEDAIQHVAVKLKEEGFGILTEIDVKAVFKEKLDVDFKEYRIFGACNPNFAYKAMQAEDKIGLMMPCNVIVTEKEMGAIEIAVVDPVASMKAIENPSLGDIAADVRSKLQKVIENL